jgi:protein TonB
MVADLAIGAPPGFDRTFAACALLSLALHGAVAWCTFTARPAAPADRRPLVATLRWVAGEPRPAPVAPRPPASAPAGPTAAPAARSLPSRSPSPAATPASPAPVAAAATSDSAVPVPPHPQPVMAEAGPVAAVDAVVPTTARSMAAARDEAMAAYRRQLAEVIGRVRDYPRVAALRGWEGEVRLHLRIARKGNLVGIALERSSGYEVLDRHALALVGDLPALPPLPEALEGHEIQVVVPVSYRLRSPT